MFAERPFQIALIISFAIHSAILIQYPNPNLNFNPYKHKNTEVKVNYIKKIETLKEGVKIKQVSREPLLRLPPKITVSNRIPPPYIDKGGSANIKEPASLRNRVFIKPGLVKSDILAIRKKITLPGVDIDKINNPTYISYYQIVREKIKRSAYQNYTGREEGEVTISFVISNDGSLQELSLVEDKSSPSQYLRSIASKSVKDASSFPAFPKELDYPFLSFNLPISFGVE